MNLLIEKLSLEYTLDNMEATHKTYSFYDSLSRIDEILNADNKQYEEKSSIPVRSGLTYTNGYYVNFYDRNLSPVIRCMNCPLSFE